MKIEIKLDDPKYCNGCPISKESPIADSYCPVIDSHLSLDWELMNTPRPQECIDRHGE